MRDALNSTWVDDTGATFQVRSLVTNLYPPAGPREVENLQIVKALEEEIPVFYGDTTHAMVLVQADFEELPGGQVRILAGGAIDPFPATLGFRLLQPQEMQALFAAIPGIMEGAASSEAPKAATVSGAETSSTEDSEEMRSCLNEMPERCVTTCVDKFGIPEPVCRVQMCRPTPTNMRGWRSRCKAKTTDKSNRATLTKREVVSFEEGVSRLLEEATNGFIRVREPYTNPATSERALLILRDWDFCAVTPTKYTSHGESPAQYTCYKKVTANNLKSEFNSYAIKLRSVVNQKWDISQSETSYGAIEFLRDSETRRDLGRRIYLETFVIPSESRLTLTFYEPSVFIF